MLARLTYYSEAAPGLTRADVDAILAACRARNPRLGVTGALAWDGRYFLQVLEGHRITLTEMLLRIGADPRNRNIVLVDARGAPRRHFADWSMADLSDFGVFASRGDGRGGVDFQPFDLSAGQVAGLLDEALGEALAAGHLIRTGAASGGRAADAA